MKLINVKLIDTNRQFKVELPNKCPHCAFTMTPDNFGVGESDSQGNSMTISFGLLLRCTESQCRKFFSVEYLYNSVNGVIELKPYFYRPPVKIDLPENIEKVSATFVEIYTQASKAEEEGLGQISGIGYRKSIEFLIKDYAIFLDKENEESVKKMYLSKVIEEHLSHFPRLQSLAKVATWIGNDETHYVRRHDDKDVRDMKQFIKSTAHFIVADYDAKLAEEFINEKN